MALELGEDNGVEVSRLCELENSSDALKRSGYSADLVCVVFADCTIQIYDMVTGELVRVLSDLPAPF